MNGYNFTERVRKVLAMAREEAVRLHHEYVGTEHILLGVLREGEGVATTVLQNLSVELDDVQQKIEEIVARGNASRTTGPDLPYTSRAKKVLELAMSEARELNHSYVGTEHLLLGLLREEKGIAAQVLVDAGVTTESARAETLRILGTEVPAPAPRPSEDRVMATMVRRPREAGQPLPQFSERLRTIIAASHKVAAERDVNLVTPVHLAMALLAHGEGTANVALDRLGLDFDATILALNELTARGTAVISPETVMGLDPDGVAALLAMEAAHIEAHVPYAGTQHLLMGLLSTSPEVATVFAAQGIAIDAVVREMWRISG
jgi:ATP-dependent Clp protease ATP-binding subunit ClpC